MTAKYPDPRPVAVYAGSFNPFTVGHLSVLERAMPLFSRVIVAIGINASKTEACDVDLLVDKTRRAVSHLPGVEVMAWDGLTVDLATREGATWLLRGARNAADYDYEYNLATVNRTLAGIETLILPTLPEQQHVSSSLVRELRHYGRPVDNLLP